ncbi:MAG: hypothetical protein AUG89_00860 [Acidobacteria bacterium 13_1_20CM_4_56_7]|nr:MAG: hypothetical protein AUG89_00860 [Acidobacteria bacterium 13_1_20CM_4_56_7]
MQRLDEMRAFGEKAFALAHRLANQAQFTMLQISQATMNDAGGAARNAGGEVILLQQKGALSGARTFTGDRYAVYATSDDHHVEVLAFERGSGFQG